MNASAAAAGKPTIRIRGTQYPVLLPTWRDPRLHLAAVIISLQVLGQVAFDFRLSIAQILVSRADVRGARGRDRVPSPARDHVARERAAHRERGRVHPARPRNRARRLVEPARLVDLRGHVGNRAALQVRDQVPRRPRLQPVELRARPLLPRARLRARRAARLLVGADVGLDGARARRSSSSAASRSSRGCTSCRSRSASGSPSRPASPSSPRPATR